VKREERKRKREDTDAATETAAIGEVRRENCVVVREGRREK